MNLNAIKEILSQSLLTEEQKEYLILSEISKDEKAIPSILAMMERERKAKKELILDFNNELGKAEIYISLNKQASKRQANFLSREFMLEKINEFYDKHKHLIGRNYNKK